MGIVLVQFPNLRKLTNILQENVNWRTALFPLRDDEEEL
jgi:hypothetical protein